MGVDSESPRAGGALPSELTAETAPRGARVKRWLLRALLVGLPILVVGGFALPRVLGVRVVPGEPPRTLPRAPAELEARWDAILRGAVHEGVVDYGLLARRRAALAELVGALAQLGPESAPSAFRDRNARLAYYINAYDILVVHAVVEEQVRRSVHDVRGWVEPIAGMGFFWALRFDLDGHRVHLHGLENDILRAQFEDARLHAAINCASASCPRLVDHAYHGAMLGAELADATPAPRCAPRSSEPSRDAIVCGTRPTTGTSTASGDVAARHPLCRAGRAMRIAYGCSDGEPTVREDILSAIGGTPLVPLRRIGADLPVPVLVKCEHMNPGGSIKDRIAKAIVLDAEERGLLEPGATLIEATAGNTGVGLAIVAAARGYRLACVMPEKMSADKRDALRALGAELVITPNAPPSSADSFQRVAERLASERGWFLTDQFRSAANVRAHEETTATEILAQTRGRIGAFVAGAGTGGTIVGVGRVLRRERPSARVVLADPIGSALADWVETGSLGPDGSYAVEGIGASEPPAILDRAVIDAAERISDEESFAMARRLVREEGLLVGGSAGTNVVAAVRVARSGLVTDPVVTVLPDGWDRYRSKPWMKEWAG